VAVEQCFSARGDPVALAVSDGGRFTLAVRRERVQHIRMRVVFPSNALDARAVADGDSCDDRCCFWNTSALSGDVWRRRIGPDYMIRLGSEGVQAGRLT